MVLIRLPVSARGAAAARTVLGETLRLRDLRHAQVTPAEIRADAALMLSELVSNAVRYARRLVLLEITLDDDMMRVAVVDDGPEQPTRRAPADHATSGRGLTIVDALADRWGTTFWAGGKSVWFELALV